MGAAVPRDRRSPWGEWRTEMTFFGMGPMEIVVIAVIALLLFGPERLPEIAGTIGRGIRDFRNAASGLTSEFERTVSDTRVAIDDSKQSVVETRDTARSTLSTVRLDQVPSPASTPTDPMPKSVQEAAVRPNLDQPVPSKADPLADLASFDGPSSGV
jgi:TatA/E family protein of Tat protein translocase